MKAIAKILTLPLAATLGIFAVVGCTADEPANDAYTTQDSNVEDSETEIVAGLDAIAGQWSAEEDNIVYQLEITDDAGFQLTVMDYTNADEATNVIDPVEGTLALQSDDNDTYIYELSTATEKCGTFEFTNGDEQNVEAVQTGSLTITIDDEDKTITMDHEAYTGR